MADLARRDDETNEEHFRRLRAMQGDLKAVLYAARQAASDDINARARAMVAEGKKIAYLAPERPQKPEVQP